MKTFHVALRVLVLAIVFVACFPRVAAASHLQGGTIYWERETSLLFPPVPPTAVRYNVVVELALRSSFYSNPRVGFALTGGEQFALAWGRLSPYVPTLEEIPLVVQSINPDQDLLIASGTVSITVPLDSPALSLGVRDCCRPDPLADGNGSTDLILESIIPALNPQTLSPRSPRPVSLPRIFLEQGKPAAFSLAALPGGTFPLQPPDGPVSPDETLPNRYRPMSNPVNPPPVFDGQPPNPTEGPALPPGAALNESTGLISWTPATAGLYDFRITIDNSYGASAPLEFIVQVLPPPATSVVFAPGICGANVATYIGLQSDLLIAASSTAPNETVRFSTTPLPPGSVLTATTSPAHLIWTPTLGALTESVCFTATSASGALSLGQCCVNLVLTSRPPPGPICEGSGVPSTGMPGFPIVRPPPRYLSLGQTGTMDIKTYDECFNPVTTGGYADRLTAVLFNGGNVVPLTAIDLGDGTYRFQFTPTAVGRGTFHIAWDGNVWETTPNFEVLASPVPPCSSWSDCVSGLCSNGLCAADTVTPQVSIESIPFPLTNRRQLELLANCRDNGHVDSATVVVNGAPVGAALVPDASGYIFVLVDLAEGLNTVLVQCRDHAGNVGGAVSELTLDTTPPAVTFVAPAAGQAIGSTTIDTTVSVADASTTFTRVNLGALLVGAPGSALLSTTVPVSASGTFTLTAFAVDAAGNTTTVSESVLVDLAAPDVTTDIANGVHVGPLAGGLLPVNVIVNSVSATTVVLPSGTFHVGRGGGIVSTAVSLVEGTNSITIRATDEIGRISEIQRSVVYDITPPTGAFVYPPEGQIVHGAVELVVDVGVDISGPVSAEVFVDGVQIPATVPGNGGTLSVPLDGALAGDGPHFLVVTLADSVGNVRTLSSAFVLDNTPPTVAVVSPSGYVHGSIEITAEAFDVTSSIASVTILMNGTSVGACAAGRCVQSFDTTTLADGPFVVSARATDIAGNSATSADVTLTAVNSAPSHFIVSPSAGAVIKTSPLVVNVAAPAPFFAGAECFFDGASLGASTVPAFSRSVALTSVLDGRSTIRCEVRNVAGQVTVESVDVTISRWEVEIKPSNLDIRSGKGGNAAVDAEVQGPGADMLIPIAGRSLTLVVPGGTPVPAKTGSNVGGSGKVKIEFDRAALISSISAGIAGTFIDPNAPLKVLLFSDARLIGADSIKLNH